MAPSNTVDVFDFRDYREFLRAYYEAGRRHGAAVSLRAFGRRAGLKSPNYLKLVMDGERNLTSEMAARFAEAAGLKGDAASYFSDLVSFTQAKTAEDRRRAHEQMIRYARYRRVYKLAAAQEGYYSRWYIPAIRELVACDDFVEDPKWIASALRPSITPRQVERALKTLARLGLTKRDDEGRLVQAEPVVETPGGPLGHHVVTFHREMMKRASASLDDVPRAQREISSLTLCLSETQVADLKARLERLREEILHSFATGPSAQRIVQVNLQMFPLSDWEK